MNGFEALQKLRDGSLEWLIRRNVWEDDKYIEIDITNGLFVTSVGFEVLNNGKNIQGTNFQIDKYNVFDILINELFFNDWELIK